MSLSLNATSGAAYFGLLWALLGAFILAAMHLRPWRSRAVSLVLWVLAATTAICITHVMGASLAGIGPALALAVLLGLLSYPVIPHLTVFSRCMLVQALYLPLVGALYWYNNLLASSASSLQWLGFGLVCACGLLFVTGRMYFVWSPLAGIIRDYPRRTRAEQTMARLKGSISRKVSIHVPTYSEPPELVIATLNAIARINYPNFEVLVIDNNTKDPSLWRPVQEHCKSLGERFRFFHVDDLPGAKAGALNYAMKHMADDTELVSIVDADYISEPGFLERYTPLFEDPKVGFVQTSHDYHRRENSVYMTGAYFEYVPVHKLTFPSLSEHDASFTVGTMCILRREALEKAGGWAEWALTEDSEVAVRIHALGYEGFTFADTAGRGLIPETMEGMKRQQFRWTAGPVQQLRKHWRLFFGLGGEGKLTLSQKIIEIQHSFARLGSVLIWLAAIPILMIAMDSIFNGNQISVGGQTFLLLLGVIIASSAIEGWITVRLAGGQYFREYLYGILVRNALQWTYIVGFLAPVFNIPLSWHRTDKFEQFFSFARAFHASRFETILALGYFAVAAFLFHFSDIRSFDLVFFAALFFLAQGAQFICTLIVAVIGEYELYAGTQGPELVAAEEDLA